MALVDSPLLSTGVSSIHNSRHSSWAAAGLPDLSHVASSPELRRLYDIDLASEWGGLHIEGINALAALDSINKRCLTPEKTFNSYTRTPLPKTSFDYFDKFTPHHLRSKIAKPKRPFHKWIKSLHRRGSHGAQVWPQDTEWEQSESREPYHQAFHQRASHEKSSSASSFGFIGAVQSASISLASASAVTRSHRYRGRSNGHSRTERSSRASLSAPRFSEDSMPLERAIMDLTATERSLQRRQILEELIGTEESYIGDLRFLINAYVTILAALPSLPERLRGSINRNLTQILQLHDEILGELHRVVPDSEYSQLEHPISNAMSEKHASGHRRWLSLDNHHANLQWLQSVPGMVSDPQVAADVAKIFSKKMHRFFIYKEYGAKYEVMIKDIALAQQNMPEWETYQRGLEAFVSSAGTTELHDGDCKKSLTIGDLLPIQRICKYPLLFAELLKCTPVLDCPNSHMEVETALVRLREATAEINRSTENDHMRVTLKKTWLLQDRMVFPERRLDASSKNQVRAFGHIQLCGALHVCWQTEEGVEGQYMICLLYKNVFCLASGGKFDTIYTILACIDLDSAKIEEVDNGRGLQCHMAPFSWKLVFESDHQLYELIMTACTLKEEAEWRDRLDRAPRLEHDLKLSSLHGFISLDIKSLGTVFGRPGTIARRMSIHRATTLGPKSSLFHVILKNTSAMRPGIGHAGGSMGLYRSQSLLSTKPRIPVLAPPRSERARLEVLLADIWSQDILPLPGMTSIARNEQIVRRSASTMMRKLSVASVAKRSGSVSRRMNEEGTAGGLTRRTSKSSDSGLDAVDLVDCGGSSPSHTTRSSMLPGTREMSEDEDWASGTRSPRLELAQVCELKPLDLAQIVPDTRIEDGLKEAPFLRTSAPNSPCLSSSESSRKSATCSGAKENAHPSFGAAMLAQSHSARWTKVRGLKSERKGHGLRRFFR
ncbi:hypothetical protein FZEAL_3794 [Fusarium zealandicum]|uniref:DH domain-containing protein n=1 Tax=Fusarium zealandicum TaxID=1053134 RepID=A0A8H4UMZ3_9HYPO|nr:hypothetical protein FZEAL_3794 [Fusarium zealandicum]